MCTILVNNNYFLYLPELVQYPASMPLTRGVTIPFTHCFTIIFDFKIIIFDF